MIKTFTRIVLIVVVLAIISHQSPAQKLKEYFIDTTDSALDISGFLNSVTGFLPVPITVTEPSLGLGGGVGIVYFHDKKNRYREDGELPPIMSMAAGIATSNGSRIGLVGHQGSYLKDRIRYTGAVGLIHINLPFHGIGLNSVTEGFEYSMKGWLTFQELMFRLNRDIPLFAGFNVLYFDNDIEFRTGIDIPGLDVFDDKLKTIGANGLLLWDSRDNFFTPNRGFMAVLEVGKYAQFQESEDNYNSASLRSYLYTDAIHQSIVAGLRLRGDYKWGNVPFTDLPHIVQRGIPAMRYQDNLALMGETEWKYNVWRRWSLVGFAGIGFTSPEFFEFELSDAKPAGGIGFRYYLARQFGIHAGIDVARGPEKWAWYLTIGSDWFR